MTKPHMVSQIPSNSLYIQLSVCATVPRIFDVSCEDFDFTRLNLDPLISKILYHDRVPVIVSRFTIFTENFVIRRYQVIKLSQHEVKRLRQCVFCEEALLFWFSNRRDNSGLLGSIDTLHP